MDEIVLLLCMFVAVPVFCAVAGIVVVFIDRKPKLSGKEAWCSVWSARRANLTQRSTSTDQTKRINTERSRRR